MIPNILSVTPASAAPTTGHSAFKGGLAAVTRGLSKFYGRLPALKLVSLEVVAGSVYVLAGGNGAGKSTLLKALLGLVRPQRGTVEVLGVSLPDDPGLIRANIGYVPEDLDWGYGWLKARDLLAHHSRYFASWDPEYASALSRAFEIPLDQRMDKLSKGQGRRVHLVMALAHRPQLLILDEPVDGLDPVARQDTVDVLRRHVTETGTSVLISTHYVADVDRLAGHLGLMRYGELFAQLEVAELHRKLRRYRAHIPPGWDETTMFGNAALHRTCTPHDIDWMVWGDEDAIVHSLASAGAMVHEVAPLALADAAVAMLTASERPYLV